MNQPRASVPKVIEQTARGERGYDIYWSSAGEAKEHGLVDSIYGQTAAAVSPYVAEAAVEATAEGPTPMMNRSR